MREYTGSMKKGIIHRILAHSYLIFLLSVVVAIIVDAFVPVRIFPESVQSAGLLCILLATTIILWAQHTSGSKSKFFENPAKVTVEHFCGGPYKYMRSPTHIGLGLLLLGYGFLMNSIIVAGVAFISFFVTRLIFIRREEAILEELYGTSYADYKKKVTF